MHDLKDLLEVVPCNICGSTETRVIYPPVERAIENLAHEFRSSGDRHLEDQLVACTRCGLQFVSPRLRHDVVVASYREGTDEQFIRQAPARERTFARSLALVEAQAPKRGLLLDVGTAGGSFMHVAAASGWRVEGCEPNRWLCEWGKKAYGLDIFAGTLFDRQYPTQGFDAVTVWDVLEHTPDPAQFLKECHRILKPGGVLAVNYPDIGSWIAKVMGRKWVFLLTVHLYYFTRTTIRDLLQRTGFEVLTIHPHIQRLEFGYVLQRAEPLAGPVARLGQSVASTLGLAGWHTPYWMGQTLVIARRVERQRGTTA